MACPPNAVSSASRSTAGPWCDSGTAAGATVAAYSVGQQIAIAALTFGIGLLAVVQIFRFRSFKEVIASGRAAREQEEETATVS